MDCEDCRHLTVVGLHDTGPRFDSHFPRGDFSRSSHTRDLKIDTPVATLPSVKQYRISPGTGWPGVSILGLGETARLIYNFYLSVIARTVVWADPQTYTHRPTTA